MAKEVEVEEIEESKGGNYGLPFGLCKKYGIALPPKATPRQAWEALKNRTGKSPEDFYRDLKSEVTQEIDKTENEIVSADKKLKEQKIKELNDKVDQSLKKFSTEYKNALKAHIAEKLDDYQRDIMLATIDKVKFTKGNGRFYPYENRISVSEKSPNPLDKELGMDFQGTTFYHEYGHYLAKLVSDKDEALNSPLYKDFNASDKMQQILTEDSKFCINKLAKEGGALSPYKSFWITKDVADAVKNIITQKSMAEISLLQKPSTHRPEPDIKRIANYYITAYGYSPEKATITAQKIAEQTVKEYDENKEKYEKNKFQIEKAMAENRRMSVLTDFVAGATRGKINGRDNGCCAHTTAYFKEHKNGVEPWAEYFRIKMTKDEKGLAIFKEYMPKTFNEYEKIYERLKDYV